MNTIIILFILTATFIGILAITFQISSIRRSTAWRNWGDHPAVVTITVVASLISLYLFATGTRSIVSGCDSTPINPQDGVTVSLSSDTWYVVQKWSNSSIAKNNQFLALEGPGSVTAGSTEGSRAWKCPDKQSAYDEALRTAKAYKTNNHSATVLGPNGEVIE